MKDTIRGKALVCGDAVLAYDIIPEKHWYVDAINEETMGPWAFEEFVPGFENKPYALRDAGYTIIVGGKGFGGGGKSIEHPMYAMKGAGVQIVVAESFSRYNFRNSIDKGLPVIQCDGISGLAKTDDELVIQMKEGLITNPHTGESLHFEPLSPFVMQLLDAGGLMEYTKNKLNRKG